MANVIMPALGMDQDKGTLVRWLKRQGEAVTKGEPIMEVETDKVVLEVPAPSAGVLSEIVQADGATVAAEQLIARIDTEATAGAKAPAAAPAPAAAAPAPAPAAARAAGGSKSDVAMPADSCPRCCRAYRP